MLMFVIGEFYFYSNFIVSLLFVTAFLRKKTLIMCVLCYNLWIYNRWVLESWNYMLLFTASFVFSSAKCFCHNIYSKFLGRWQNTTYEGNNSWTGLARMVQGSHSRVSGRESDQPYNFLEKWHGFLCSAASLSTRSCVSVCRHLHPCVGAEHLWHLMVC